MIGLVQVGVQAMADRYAYLSFIGLFLMFCWGIADLGRSSSCFLCLDDRRRVILLLLLAGLLVISLATGAMKRLCGHTPSDQLRQLCCRRQFRYGAAGSPGTGAGHRALPPGGRYEPHDALSQLNIGVYEERNHHWPEAIAAYKEGIAQTDEADIWPGPTVIWDTSISTWATRPRP